ncbi:MAG: aspartate kinase [Kiritimatiellae bacterium]|nr:aspartate kinase [Kiritimatiellia bacterium]
MKVSKFGGSSLASAEQVRKVRDIVFADEARRLIVVSAPGRRDPSDIKVTDLLIRCADAQLQRGRADAEREEVLARYREIADSLRLSRELVDAIETDLKARLAGDTSDAPKFTDTLKAAGEDNCARLVAEYFRAQGREARYVNPKDAGLLLSDEPGNARVLPQSYARLAELRNAPGIQVFPGFFGYSADGSVVTFPRGGSDITGAVLAAAVKADIYENWTDVSSVFAANPKVVADARPIQELTYREMRELSYAGFSVFHEEALEPVFHAGVPVRILNTDEPEAPGTAIVFERKRGDGPVVGIGASGGFCSIYISKYLMNREIGFGRKVLSILEEERLSYEHTPSGIDNISVILRESQFKPNTLEHVVGRIERELATDAVGVEHDLALIMIVGEGMRHTVGIAARAADSLADAAVNIEMINQGSSEVSIMFGVKAEDTDRAVQALYREFFPE